MGGALRGRGVQQSAGPLYLRIPNWCERAAIKINDEPLVSKLTPGKIACIDREWKANDEVELLLPMGAKPKKWESNGTVSVVRGPLTFSLEIKEKYARY